MGIIAGYLVGSKLLKDEYNVIWYWMKDWIVKKLWWNIYRIEWDWKMGAMCWWHYYGIGVPQCHTGVTYPSGTVECYLGCQKYQDGEA